MEGEAFNLSSHLQQRRLSHFSAQRCQFSAEDDSECEPCCGDKTLVLANCAKIES
ncbi:unnamed protein product, partial [Sphenostylis stenocarpa]